MLAQLFSKIFAIIKWLLLPFGAIHLAVVRLRNKLYDLKWLTIRLLPVPVISVGNIQMGGSGKTPMVLNLVALLQEKGVSVGILTRGYARKSGRIRILHGGEIATVAEIGDEPAMMLRVLSSNSWLGIGANRYLTGLALLAKKRVDVLILDDGMQHRKLHRDLDFCLIDVSRWHNHPFLYPFSYLRDAKVSLKRAGFILLTKSENATKMGEKLHSQLSERFGGAVLKAHFQFGEFEVLVDGSAIQLAKNTPVVSLCGIANPQHFQHTLRQSGADIKLNILFPDHHNYTHGEMAECAEQARLAGAEYIITTEKDAVKIRELLQPENSKWSDNILVLPVVVNLENPEVVEKQIDNLLNNRSL